ncbi:hypothetical protein QPK24_04765 [Paenibacillus polygoni]|uniref:Uncharacterized protein n=1 Tax=Paenibacillus polygoni TaxID=3050112 RepID=A0ABY8X3C2_9BACL|nr:hypothetical protein [Paenibacillus polygoni]WIV20032.1 hypothetical protein QPK24_04765 [Paenibacillus polygoni]
MEWFTFGNMVETIRIGQKASTPGFSRTVIRTPSGLYWTGGIWNGKIVEIRDYLFSDIWTIYEDEESLVWEEYREPMERKIVEMITNQYEEERAQRREEKKAKSTQTLWKNKDVF